MLRLRRIALTALALVPALFLVLWSILLIIRNGGIADYADYGATSTLVVTTASAISNATLALVPALFLVLWAIFKGQTHFFHDFAVPIADPVAVYVAISTLVVTTASAISTIWLAWRGDRRQSREFELKIQQLQLQLNEARKSQNSC